VVLRDGAVIETGTHHQLLEIEGGLYAELWSKQATGGQGRGENGAGSEAGSTRGFGSVASLAELAERAGAGAGPGAGAGAGQQAARPAAAGGHHHHH